MNIILDIICYIGINCLKYLIEFIALTQQLIDQFLWNINNSIINTTPTNNNTFDYIIGKLTEERKKENTYMFIN